MKKMVKRVIGDSVGASVMSTFHGAIDESDMGTLGTATKTTASAGFLNKVRKGWGF